MIESGYTTNCTKLGRKLVKIAVGFIKFAARYFKITKLRALKLLDFYYEFYFIFINLIIQMSILCFPYLIPFGVISETDADSTTC